MIVRLLKTLFCCGVCVVFLSLHAFSQTSEMPTDVDSLAAKYFGTDKPIVGGVIGIVDGKKCYAKGYGLVSLEKTDVPDVDTIYEIASMSKVFTGVLLGEMVARGELAIDDPLEKFYPKETSLPNFHGNKITLKHLASHCSGIPRLPTDFWETANQTPDNPYLCYSAEKIVRFLNDYQLTAAPGTRYEYSNLGMSIVGVTLERMTGKSYETLVQERIAQPLEMKNIAVTLTDNMRQKLAPPYNAEKKRVSNWDMTGFAAGGGLRTSMRDLIKFAQANALMLDSFSEFASQPKHPLIRGISKAAEWQFEDVSHNRRVGLGWHIEPSGVLMHNGQTGGYHSFILVDPKSHRAVILLTNTATETVDALGYEIFKTK
ncbi:MAG: beta-lactamase family protein [Planctomycetaceae bacterium]|nr:beta-lactamase family protein [Planctomycetaceae bacterium]